MGTAGSRLGDGLGMRRQGGCATLAPLLHPPRSWYVLPAPRPSRSWYRWLVRYVYVPCGGGPPALLAAVALSAALHGAHRRVLGCGVGCLGSAAARVDGGRCWQLTLPPAGPASHPHCCSGWWAWGAIQATALLVERGLSARPLPGAGALHPHLRAALAQCATQTTLLVQVR